MSTQLSAPTMSAPTKMCMTNLDATGSLTRRQSPPPKSRLDKTQLIQGHYRRVVLNGFRMVPQEKPILTNPRSASSDSSDSAGTIAANGEGCIMQANANNGAAGSGIPRYLLWGPEGMPPNKDAFLCTKWVYSFENINRNIFQSVTISAEQREAFYTHENVSISPAPPDATMSSVSFPTLAPRAPQPIHGKPSTLLLPEAYQSGFMLDGSNAYQFSFSNTQEQPYTMPYYELDGF